MDKYINLRRSRKAASKQTMSYLVLLIIVVIFMATVGVRLILNLSLFVASLGSNKGGDQHLTNILIEPELENYPEATNSATVIVSGFAASESTVHMEVNGVEQEEGIVPADDGTFETELSLEKDDNLIRIISYTKNKKDKKASKEYTITYRSEKPTVTIDSPTDGSFVSTEEIDVNGHATSSALVKVNGQPAVINSEGNFSKTVRLKEGENTITVTAVDDAGNEVESTVKVTYEKN